MKGFRKGKIPARIDQRFGRGAVLEEAVNDALPKLKHQAVNEAELNVLGQPEVDITELKDGETLNFTAEVDVRPTIEIPDYSGIEVEVDAVEVADEDVEKAVEELRERFASTSPVERAAQDGDVVTIDLEAKVDGEVLEDGVAADVTIGSGELLDGIDEAVKGLEAVARPPSPPSSRAARRPARRPRSPSRSPRSPRANCPSSTTTSRSSPPSRHPRRAQGGQPQAPREHEAVRPGHAGPGACPGEAARAGRGPGPREAARGRDQHP